MPDDASTELKAATTTAAGEVIKLWSAPPSRTIEGVPPEATFQGMGGTSIGTTMLRNVSEPTLTVYAPAPGKGNGSGVIVCPGGGWSILAWQHEGIDVAEWFAARGYTAFLLKYRVSATPADPAKFAAAVAAQGAMLAQPLSAAKAPRVSSELIRNEALTYAREIAADDGRRALQLVRERAGDFGVEPDRIGLIGFSAGAFLVTDVTMDPQGPPPAFLAPIYGGETRGRRVPADAPPLFTVIAHDDRYLFHMVEGLYSDWSMADHSAELHIFARGAHGFGMVKQGLPSDRWIDLLGAWLADKGFG
jgi:dienelactone hydrolase